MVVWAPPRLFPSCLRAGGRYLVDIESRAEGPVQSTRRALSTSVWGAGARVRERIVPELIAHQAEQSFESLTHVHRLGPQIDLRGWTEAEHAYTASAIRIRRAKSASLKLHALSMRRPLASVNVKTLCACIGAASIFTFTSPAALRCAAAFRLDRCR